MQGNKSVLLPKTVFVACMKMKAGEERDSFLKEACFDDPEMYAHICDLIRARESIATNPLDVVVKVLEPNVTAYATPEVMAASHAYDGTIDVAAHPLIGPYKIMEVLGQGGMGTVYRAEQLEPVRRQVALKIIRPGMDSREVIARFEAERQALAMMDHPNIARVLEAGMTAEMRPYFAMELVRGMPINEFVEKRKLPVRERLELFVLVCQAVQHAHQKGIIHRDLKPSNILVTIQDGVPVPKVIDFGVAKALNQKLTERTLYTQLSQMVGTPLYMSPEQAELTDRDVDTRSDIYSLGVLLYELLTGSTPFDKAVFSELGYDEIRRIIRFDDPLRPSVRLSTLSTQNGKTTVNGISDIDLRKLRLSLKGELDWVVMKALSKDRELRYRSANEFAEDVQRYLEGKAVLACSPPLGYRFRKFCIRHWVALSIFTVFTTSILCGGGIAISQAMRAISAEKEAEIRENEAKQLLEAARLQQLVASFRDRHYCQIPTLKIPNIASKSSGEASGDQENCSLIRLLQNAGAPTPLREFLHPDAVNDISVSEDSQLLLAACNDGKAYLWKLDSGTLIRTFGPHLNVVESVAISPDSKLFLTGGRDGLVLAWNLEAKTPVRQIASFPSGVETMVWSSDGKYLAAGARYSEARVWTQSFEEVIKFENHHRHESLLFSEDSQKIYIPTENDITSWDLQTGQRIGRLGTGTIKNIRTMCWVGTNDRYIMCADRFSETMMIIDPETNELHSTLTTNHLYPQHLHQSPDQTRIAAVHEDGQLRIYDVSKIENKSRDMELHDVNLFQTLAHDRDLGRASVGMFVDDRYLLSSGQDGKVVLWDTACIAPVNTFTHKDPIAYAIPAETDEVAIFLAGVKIGGKTPLRVNSRGELKPIKDQDLPAIPSFVSRPCRSNLFITCFKHRMEVRDIKTGEIVSNIKVDFDDGPVWAAMSRDSQRIAAVTLQQTVEVWESKDRWKSSRKIASIPFAPRDGVCFADDGNTLIADHDDEFIVEWNLTTNQEQVRYDVSRGHVLLASPDSRYLAVALGPHVQVIDRATGEIALERENLPRIVSLLFSDNERILLTGHRDGRIRAWHIPTQEELGVVYQPPRPLGIPHFMSFLDRGDRLMIHYDNYIDISARSTIVILGNMRPQITQVD